MSKTSLSQAKWLKQKSLLNVFDALEASGGEVRVNGGAVRNALMGEEVSDVDLSTTLLPDQTIKALENVGIKAVPTGLEHGTITAVSKSVPYEITTLREDIETDGRHAVVKFGIDWERDAMRRDLTMNALYCDREGNVYDPLNGMADVENREIRFIGNSSERIEEDYLRILRFFRFFAWYGSGRPDADGIKACAKLKEGLAHVSIERIWMELRKLLSAKDPSRAMLWMRTTGVLSKILPESEKWGIDLIPHLISVEGENKWPVEPLLRLASMVRPDEESLVKLSRRLKVSGKEEKRLLSWAMSETPDVNCSEDDLSKALFLGDQQGVVDAMKLELAKMQMREDTNPDHPEKLSQLIKFSERWKQPVFPVSGKDLQAKGMSSGPEMGKALSLLEKKWLDSGFKLTKQNLLKED